MENLANQLVDKSIEAFVMGLEIYNKPTIKYRVEGFSFFICNAWELMMMLLKVGMPTDLLGLLYITPNEE